MKTFLLIVALSLLFFAGTARAVNDVAVCHHEGNGSYHLIYVAAAGAYNGHMGLSHQDGLDVIPPFEFQNAIHSQRWDSEGQAIFAECEPASTDTPTITSTPTEIVPTETIVVTSTATESVTATVTPTETNNASPSPTESNTPTVEPTRPTTVTRLPDTGSGMRTVDTATALYLLLAAGMFLLLRRLIKT